MILYLKNNTFIKTSVFKNFPLLERKILIITPREREKSLPPLGYRWMSRYVFRTRGAQRGSPSRAIGGDIEREK